MYIYISISIPTNKNRCTQRSYRWPQLGQNDDSDERLKWHTFICLSYHLPICLSTYLSIHLCIYLSFCLSVYIYISISISTYTNGVYVLPKSVSLLLWTSLYIYRHLYRRCGWPRSGTGRGQKKTDETIYDWLSSNLTLDVSGYLPIHSSICPYIYIFIP